jgi:hypothetical protein
MKQTRRNRRAGNIVVLTSALMVLMIAFVAFAVDVGYLYTMRSQLQRAADSAAMAAAWEFVDENAATGGSSAEELSADARALAEEYAALNPIINEPPELATDDVEVGYIYDPTDTSASMIATPAGAKPNAVRVRVQRTSLQNGRVPLFFARVLGYDTAAAHAEATAALMCSVGGFQIPADGSNLGILPFALDVETWDALVNDGIGTDSYAYNSSTGNVTGGADGVLEVNLFPQATGSQANRGTVDIGGSGNTTDDICRQIREGCSPADLQELYDAGGSLALDSSGELVLSGDTGISSAVKDDLTGIVGQTRILPLFSVVNGPGNNAEYTIVGFVGMRVMHVKLTGSISTKKVVMQPASVVTKGALPPLSTPPGPGSIGTSTYIYSPVWLVK